jgi:hypothetical protein
MPLSPRILRSSDSSVSVINPGVSLTPTCYRAFLNRHVTLTERGEDPKEELMDSMDVVAFLRGLPDGAVFTHATPGRLPDSWVKVGTRYRRTYDWIEFEDWQFASWAHAELTEPVEGSISQTEANRLAAAARHRESSKREPDA